VSMPLDEEMEALAVRCEQCAIEKLNGYLTSWIADDRVLVAERLLRCAALLRARSKESDNG
jgi:hypothetical protein